MVHLTLINGEVIDVTDSLDEILTKLKGPDSFSTFTTDLDGVVLVRDIHIVKIAES